MARVKYVVEMEWLAGDNQYEPLELLGLLDTALGNSYDIRWYSCTYAPEPSPDICEKCGQERE